MRVLSEEKVIPVTIPPLEDAPDLPPLAEPLTIDAAINNRQTAGQSLLRRPAAFDFLSRKCFDLFIGRVFQHLKPGDAFKPNWLVGTMAWHLSEVLAGREQRLILNVPPRHLKSICSSVAFPAFLLGHDPTTPIILVCYSSELGEKMMRDLRSVMACDWYKRLFPKTRLKKDTASEIVTHQGGGVNMTSVQGTLTGRGARVIIVDDPIKASDVTSEAERKRTNQWFQDTLFTRLDDKRTGSIVVAMQRLHEDDVTGHLTNDPGHNWTVVKVPAIADERTKHRILQRPSADGQLGPDIHIREAGSLIDPAREDRDTLAGLRSDLGSHTFAAQYQQNPIARDGNLVPRAWFKDYVWEDDRAGVAEMGVSQATFSILPNHFDAIVASWDTASAVGANNDFSVGTIWGVKDNRYYLLDLYRIKLSYPALKQRIFDTNRQHRVNLNLLEAADSGRNLYHDLKQTGRSKYRTITPAHSKEDRLAACSAVIEEGRVYLPLRAPWKEALLAEIMAFPNSRHDDQVDSLSMFINYMRTQTNGRLVYDRNGRRVMQRRPGSRIARV